MQEPGLVFEKEMAVTTVKGQPEVSSRESLIQELVEASLGYNLDDVANTASYFKGRMNAAKAALLPAEIEEAERRFEAAWAKETHYCSGATINH
jgi:hypothetical protein